MKTLPTLLVTSFVVATHAVMADVPFKSTGCPKGSCSQEIVSPHNVQVSLDPYEGRTESVAEALKKAGFYKGLAKGVNHLVIDATAEMLTCGKLAGATQIEYKNPTGGAALARKIIAIEQRIVGDKCPLEWEE